MGIHSTAILHSSAEICSSVHIGPFSIIEEKTSIDEGTVIGSGCHIFPGVHLGKGVHLFDGAQVGAPPQDLKYRGEATKVNVGSHTRIREYAVISSGTGASGITDIGSNCLLMAYVHVAHDCVIGNKVIIANGVQMGGHVVIGDTTVISGMTGIHQFTTIGPGSFIGGGLRVARDILPFSRALGEPLTWAGVNDVGLKKMGFGPAEATFLKQSYRVLHNRGISALLHSLEERAAGDDGIETVAGMISDFLSARKRGILR